MIKIYKLVSVGMLTLITLATAVPSIAASHPSNDVPFDSEVQINDFGVPTPYSETIIARYSVQDTADKYNWHTQINANTASTSQQNRTVEDSIQFCMNATTNFLMLFILDERGFDVSSVQDTSLLSERELQTLYQVMQSGPPSESVTAAGNTYMVNCMVGNGYRYNE